MRKGTIFILFILPLLTGCSFYGSLLDKKQLCESTLNDIVKEDYETILKTLKVDPADTIKAGQTIAAVKEFRKVLVENFGTEFNTWFMSGTKKYSSKGDEPDISTVQIQIDNNEFYIVTTFTIDDSDGHIQNVHLAEEKVKIPNLTMFWLFGVLPLGVLFFNIFSIRKVVKSELRPKWAYVLLCILLNIPSLDCFMDFPNLRVTADLSFQMLFGISFNFMGYDNYALGCGLPIGSFIVHFLIYRQRRKTEMQLQANIGQ